MKKSIALLLSATLLINLVACQTSVPETSGTSLPTDSSKVENKQPNTINVKKGSSTKEKKSKFVNKSMEQIKKDLEKLVPELIESIPSVLANTPQLQKDFDMTNTQVLLVSNITRTAYLLNSQNETYGTPDDIIEYAMDTLTDKSIKTQPFFDTQFNDRNTYVFNMDFLAMRMDSSVLLEETVSFFIHEAFHIYYHRDYLHSKQTAERSTSTLRGEDYPVNRDEKNYRAQMLYYYQQALKSEAGDEKVTNIKKANYFYKLFADQSPQNKQLTYLDQVEGYARYMEYRTLSLIQGYTQQDSLLNNSTKLLLQDDEQQQKYIHKKNRQTSLYATGACGYGLIYDLGFVDEVGDGNPLQFLLDKYGITETEGNKELELLVDEECDKIDATHKIKVDHFQSKLDSENFMNILIPAYKKYEANNSSLITSNFTRFQYKNDMATLTTLSKDIQLGDNRIKLTQAEVLTRMKEDGVYYNVLVPLDDVDIDNNRITVQGDKIQIYDASFELIDGEYILIE